MAFLKLEDIKKGRIIYQCKKTSKNYNIKTSDKINDILKFYTVGKSQKDFIFPIILRDKPEQQYQDVIRLRKMYNDKLKSIARLCGIEQSLFSYVSRHSFATNAMLQNILIQAISTMLGHSKLKTTQIYLKSLPNEILDDYNLKISGSL
ncbi:MAG: tyrosine-type recombinase/integrase [Psychroserpens sp.]|uniref:tyrosine-type recombinase/integrase n=1 Tax=Psychroserpens sp. TaxID=2020870 RepID=UPI003CBBBB1D